MRIAVYSDYFFPELGGIQDSIAITARALAARGHEIDLIVPRYRDSDYARIGHVRAEPDLGPGVRVHRRMSLPFPSSTQQSRAAIPAPWLRPWPRGRGPDVIHVHSFFGIGLEALAVAGMTGRACVGTNHTTIAGFGPHLPVSVARASAFVVWFYGRCDRVTAPSHSVFSELGADRLQPVVVSNPIDTALFTPPTPERRAAMKQRFGLGPRTITYAGRLGAEKNIDIVLKAAAGLAGEAAAADIAIAGHGAHAPALQRLAGELGLGARVRFLGTLPPSGLAELFQASDIFTMMSTSETQSMAMLQAMASGVPVIAARARALTEYVTSGNGLLVGADDEAGLTAALQALLDDPGRRRLMAEAGRAGVEACSISSTTDTWEAIYRSMLPGSAHT